MKISAQEEYGLRCLLQLARTPEHQVVRVKDIAAGEGLSNAYVEKLLRLLSRSGLVHSVRGVKGGYVLNRPASAVTLGEVVRALGSVQTTDHLCHQFTGLAATCVHFSNCGIRSVWSGLTTHIQGFLDRTPLSSLLESEYAVAEQVAKRFTALGGVEKRSR